MVFQKISIHPINLKVAIEGFEKVAPSKQESKDVISWIENLAMEENLKERRQLRLLRDMGTYYSQCKGPPLKTIKRSDLEQIKQKFRNKEILKQNGEPYADTVVEGITETIVRFLESTQPKRMNSFISKNNKPLRKWFIMRAKKKTPETLTEHEIRVLYDGAKPLWQKYAIAVLFGSGVRIEEFLNFRFEDFEEPTKNFPYFKVDVKEEYSKTLGRNIGLYWEHCTEAITKYLASIEKGEPKDRVLAVKYDAVRMFLSRLGKKLLNKRVHPHMFRKSSATHYASKFNRQQLCKRFGWTFSSDVVDTYISRSGIDEFEVKEVILNDDISKIRQENNELKTRLEQIEKKLQEDAVEVNAYPNMSEAEKKAVIKQVAEQIGLKITSKPSR